MEDIGTPDPTAVREQLARIVASPDFGASNRNRRFLEYIVTETLGGHQNHIKAYTIATCVFGRGADFDPQIDSIVRIEAGRLRRMLERYYLTAGRADPVIISIPKGCYVPEFALNAPAPDPPRSDNRPPRECRGPSILVPGFEEEGDQSLYPNLTRGFTRHVIAGLTRFTELAVFGPDTSVLQSEPGEARVDYLLTGGTTISATHFGAEVLLIEVRTGRCLWGEVFECPLDPGGWAGALGELASAVVRALAQPYGAIFVAQTQDVDAATVSAGSSAASVMLFRRYARTFDRSLRETVRRALEAARERDPDNAELYGCLSQIHTDMLRFGSDQNAARAELARRALDLARRAIDLAPNASRSHHALSRAYWFAGDVAGSFEELAVARALNPNDTAILADLGQQHAVMAHWDEAIALLETAYARNPGLPSSYRIGFALYHFAHGRFAEALAEAHKVDVSGVVYGALMVAASAVRLGREPEAHSALRTVAAIDPDYGAHAAADLARRNVDPDLAAAILSALADAGLPIGPGATHRTATLRPIRG
ncbi:hypothetical protein L1787_10070 [Acuticoccus sp. M5D2P5]|uniref:hypothetical protein n=1 Tax=Acuticoccus kalidii TaxID=2910977 RepID=UPI001F17603D|nr:hypothetical protein [Acuticoccus kalidii]MCF3933760.1 hypothetical protein [Acuticoccus kalidii]